MLLSKTFSVISKPNKSITWNNTANIRCRPDTAEGHFKSEMHKDAYEASQRKDHSYFDREEEKKVTMLKNVVYFKVFRALYWLAKEEIASTKNYLVTRIN